MIKITLNNKTYKGAYRWDDVTLQQFCDLAAIELPEGYENYIKADSKFSVDHIDEYVTEVSKITEKQLNVDFPCYYRKVVRCLTNIPVDKIGLLSNEQVNDMYEYYFKPFVCSIIHHVPLIHFMGNLVQYQPKDFKRFRIGLNLFKVPETVTIMEQEIPLLNEPVITYIEASDIFRNLRITKDDVKRLALFMAIYCRKWGEKYNEQKALARQNLFMKVPMSIVWSVFFYTLKRMPESGKTMQLFFSLPKQIHEVVHQAQVFRSLVTEG